MHVYRDRQERTKTTAADANGGGRGNGEGHCIDSPHYSVDRCKSMAPLHSLADAGFAINSNISLGILASIKSCRRCFNCSPYAPLEIHFARSITVSVEVVARARGSDTGAGAASLDTHWKLRTFPCAPGGPQRLPGAVGVARLIRCRVEEVLRSGEWEEHVNWKILGRPITRSNLWNWICVG